MRPKSRDRAFMHRNSCTAEGAHRSQCLTTIDDRAQASAKSVVLRDAFAGRPGACWRLGSSVREDKREETAAAPTSYRAPRGPAARTRAEDLRGELELLFPVVDDGAPEEAVRPLVHLAGDPFGHFQEDRASVDRQPQVPLVVQRHRGDLTKRVLPVEHPPIGARQQCIGDVPDALLDRSIRPRRRTGALNPLPLQIGRNLASHERPVASIADFDAGPRDLDLRIEEANPLLVARSPRSSPNPRVHHRFPVLFELDKRPQRRRHLGRKNVGVVVLQVAANLQLIHVPHL